MLVLWWVGVTCHPSTSGRNLQSDLLNVKNKSTRTGVYVVCVCGCMYVHVRACVSAYVCALPSPNNHNDLSAFLYKRGLRNF